MAAQLKRAHNPGVAHERNDEGSCARVDSGLERFRGVFAVEAPPRGVRCRAFPGHDLLGCLLVFDVKEPWSLARRRQTPKADQGEEEYTCAHHGYECIASACV